MAKQSYKIRTSLDRTFLDQEIRVTPELKALPLKVITFFILSAMVLFWLVSSTFIGRGPLILTVMFIALWLGATAFFGTTAKTKEMKFMQVPALLEYLPKQARRVVTRRSSSPNAFYSVAGIEDLGEDGLITYIDKTYARAFLISGSASVLLFDEDRREILDRVERFWRKQDTNVEFITMTTKEPQRVYRQKANLARRNRKMKPYDLELKELLDEDYDILNDYVGEVFRSIHQYLIIKADSMEALRGALANFHAEVEENPLMFKSAVALDGRDVTDMLSVLYRGRT